MRWLGRLVLVLTIALILGAGLVALLGTGGASNRTTASGPAANSGAAATGSVAPAGSVATKPAARAAAAATKPAARAAAAANGPAARSGAAAGRPAATAPAAPVDFNPHPAAGNFKADGTTLEQCTRTQTGAFACYQQAFGNLAFRQGPEQALALLGRLLAANDPVIRGDCHTIAHLIGSAALARYHGDTAQAIAHGSTLCGSGFYHGLIEHALNGATTTAQLVAQTRAICSDRSVLTTTFLLYQCVHGLGHGLMIYSADNLPFALSMCDKLNDQWSQQSCDGGVFMQNFNPPDALSPFNSTYVKKSDPLYPCDWVGASHKFYCYLQITQHILSVTHYDWARTAQTCARAERGWVAICFQSYGRDASGASEYNPRVALSFCNLTGTHIADCLYGVVRDFANNDGSGKRAARLCAIVPGRLTGFCFYGISTIFQTFGHSAPQLRADCQAITARYVDECMGFLTPQEERLLSPAPSPPAPRS